MANCRKITPFNVQVTCTTLFCEESFGDYNTFKYGVLLVKADKKDSYALFSIKVVPARLVSKTGKLRNLQPLYQ